MSKTTTNFAARYKKDLSTEALKAKLVHRKSILQKESRHNRFNRGRQFGLADVNTQHVRGKELSRLEETGEVHSAAKSTGKPKQMTNAKACGKERLEMLQRYKAEKELRKLKEQREKPVFKCGRYKPEMPCFLPQLSQIPVPNKAKEKASGLPVRVTRSKAKNALEENASPTLRPQASMVLPKCTSKSSRLEPPQHRQQHIYVDKPIKKENKGAQPAVPTTSSGRVTRATAAAMSRGLHGTAGAQPAVPTNSSGRVTRATAAAMSKGLHGTAGNLAQERVTGKGKQKTENKHKEAFLVTKEDSPVKPLEERVNFQLASAGDVEEAEAFPEKENTPVLCIPAVPSRRTRSFAPQNFVFQPLEGVASFKVSPMTPSRASSFLSADLTWVPIKTTSDVPTDDALETTPQDYRSESGRSTAAEVIKDDPPECQSSVDSLEDKMEHATKEEATGVTGEMEIDQRLADLPAPETSEPMGEPPHDVPYFRNILHSETERLTSCCLEWDGIATMDIPEDAQDLVRTTVGQTRLLLGERFKQFEGLVDNCEFRRGEKETTRSDLDGFWDMVAFQVEDVNKKFESLRKLQENRWQTVEDPQPEQIPKKKTTFQRASKATSRSAGKAAARKRLATIKAMMKNKMKPEGLAASRETPEEEEEGNIFFDGGFFQVESPAKPFPGHTPKSASRSSRRPSRQVTPRSASRAFLRSCVDTCVARLGTPEAPRSCLPSPYLTPLVGPSQINLLSCVPDQSHTDAAEGSGAVVDSVAEETDETQTASAGSTSFSSDLTDSVSVDSLAAESPDCKKEAPGVIEEVQQAAAGVGEEGVVCSPEKDSLFEQASSQGEDQRTPECQTGSLLGDFSCDGGTQADEPNLNCSLFFTPLKNGAQTFAAAASDDNLIAFSPLPAGEK